MATPSQRQLAAAIASLTRWSRIHGPDARRAATQKARDGQCTKFEAQVIAEAGRELSAEELAAAVDRLRRAHYRRMALASAKARSRTTRGRS